VKPALLEQTISEKLATTCSTFPHRFAIKTPGLQLTYRELDQKSNALASGLLGLGVKKGHRVAVSLGNCAAYGVVCKFRLNN